MARKQKQQPIPVQLKHLRFVDPAGREGQGEILNQGGFTIAYRLFDLSRAGEALRAEWEQNTGYLAQFAYSECSRFDNYNKAEGRNRAIARLNNMAPDWSHTFLLDAVEEGTEVVVLDQERGIVDLLKNEEVLSRAVIDAFLSEMQPFLNTGNAEEPLEGFLIYHGNMIAIDSAALLVPVDGDDYEEDDLGLSEAIVEAEQAINEVLDNTNIDDKEQVVNAFTAIRKIVSDMRLTVSDVLPVGEADDEEDGDDNEGECDDEGCPHYNTPHGHDASSVVAAAGDEKASD